MTSDPEAHGATEDATKAVRPAAAERGGGAEPMAAQPTAEAGSASVASGVAAPSGAGEFAPGAPDATGSPRPTGSKGRGRPSVALVLAGGAALSALALTAGFVGGRLVASRNTLSSEQVAATLVAEAEATVAAMPTLPPKPKVIDDAGVSVGLVEEGKASIGEPAPDFTLQTPDGDAIALADLAGKPVLLNFFATWCIPCRAEMPMLQDAHERHPDDLVILAVDLQETPEAVTEYWSQMGLDFPVVVDANGITTLTNYRVSTLPTSVLVDPDGTVANIRVGPFANGSDLESHLAFILHDEPTPTP